MKKQSKLPKHVSKSKKAVKVEGQQAFFPGLGFGGYGGFGFGAPFAGIGAGIGVTPFGPVAGVGIGAGIGFGGFGYYGGWL